ncbi:Platelet-activating factor acetylhydrolase [Daphnia magna]|uniref:Platelet-activating factor acetylhydrolase n=1 Tax=Daphnia magna TaxID=35525 RepID=A0A0P5WSB6_9CRUS|nr:Platelet-activating factor acetylhydrolase [Daphnia magna]
MSSTATLEIPDKLNNIVFLCIISLLLFHRKKIRYNYGITLFLRRQDTHTDSFREICSWLYRSNWIQQRRRLFTSPVLSYQPPRCLCRENSSRWANWIPHQKYIEGYAIVRRLIPWLGNILISWAFGDPYIPVVADAEPCTRQRFPVIVFSHGLTACRTTYSTFCSDLSSHGFIVAAIEHRDGSACMSFSIEKGQNKGPLTKWIPYQPMQFEKDDMPLRQQQLQIRMRECSQTLDLLFKLNGGAELEYISQSSMNLASFKGAMDLSSPVIAGHSFGSTTLLRTLATDQRYKIGLAMDAWMWPLKDELELTRNIQQPVLFINSETFQTAANLDSMKRFVANADYAERSVLTLRGSIHDNQNDVPYLLPWYIRRFTYHSVINPLLAIQLNNCISLRYLRQYLGHPLDDEHSKLSEHYAQWIYQGIP